MPSRGSLISRTSDATSSRTRSACRRVLAGSDISSTSDNRARGGLTPRPTAEAYPRRAGDERPAGAAGSVVVAVEPALDRQQVDLGPAGHLILAGVDDATGLSGLGGDRGDADQC